MRKLINGLSIKIQVLIPVLLISVVMTAGLLVGRADLDKSMEDVAYTAHQLSANKDELAAIINNTYAMRISAVYSLYDPEELKVLANNLDKGFSKNRSSMNKLREMKGLSNEIDGLTSAMKYYIQYSKSPIMPLLKEKHSGDYNVSEYNLARAEYRRAGAAMVTAIEVLSEKLNILSEAQVGKAEDSHDSVLNTGTVAIFVAIFASLICAYWLSTMIVAPISAIQKVMQRIAKGDLNVTVEEGDNEITALSRDINSTVSQLRTTVDSMVRISEDVASASTELAAVMTQAQANSDQEKQEIEQVASAVNQLSSTADNVNSSALSADTTAHQASEMAAHGLKLYQDSAAASTKMAEQITSAANVVNNLKDQSSKANDGMQSSLDVLAEDQKLAHQVNEALMGITESVNDITSLNTHVANAAAEQTQVTNDINRNITTILRLLIRT